MFPRDSHSSLVNFLSLEEEQGENDEEEGEGGEETGGAAGGGENEGMQWEEEGSK